MPGLLFRMITCCWLLSFSSQNLIGQDPTLSQFFSNKMYLNPALTGFEGGTTVHLNYRHQRFNLAGQEALFQSNSLGADLSLPCLQSAIGLMYLDNVEGEGYLKWQSISAAYAWHSRPQLDRYRRDMELRFGMRASYNWRSLNQDNLIFNDQLESFRGVLGPTNLPLPGDVRTNTDYVDFHSGLLWMYRKGPHRLRMGMSLSHLMRVDQSVQAPDDTLPLRTTFHASVVYGTSRNGIPIHVVPFVRLDLQKGGELSLREAFFYQSLEYGVLINTRSVPSVWGGAWIRASRSFEGQPGFVSLMMMLGFEFPNHRDYAKAKSLYRFGLSYDYQLAGLPSGSSHIFEVSLVIRFPHAEFYRCSSSLLRQIPAGKF